MFKRLLKPALIIASISLLLLTSELIYSIKNPSKLSTLLFVNAKYFSTKDKVALSYNILNSGTYLLTKANKKQFALLDENSNKLNFFKSLTSLEKNNLIKNLITHNDLNSNIEYDYALIYYTTAIELYNEYPQYGVSTLLEEAFYLNPTLSYWPVELANYYYFSGSTDKAMEILQICQLLPEPKKHCEIYQNHIISSEPPFDPGFLQPEINEFYMDMY